MNRDQLIRELRIRSGTWQSTLIVYALIVATMAFSAMVII